MTHHETRSLTLQLQDPGYFNGGAYGSSHKARLARFSGCDIHWEANGESATLRGDVAQLELALTWLGRRKLISPHAARCRPVTPVLPDQPCPAPSPELIVPWVAPPAAPLPPAPPPSRNSHSGYESPPAPREPTVPAKPRLHPSPPAARAPPPFVLPRPELPQRCIHSPDGAGYTSSTSTSVAFSPIHMPPAAVVAPDAVLARPVANASWLAHTDAPVAVAQSWPRADASSPAGPRQVRDWVQKEADTEPKK